MRGREFTVTRLHLPTFQAMRNFFAVLSTSLLFLTLQTRPAVGQNPRDTLNLKNVVVILADDHMMKVTGAYGNDIIRTPNIDKLSEQGITFDRAYCNAPICSASRASLLTGKYPHATGVNLLFTPFPDDGNVTIAEHLQEQSFSTALFGKSHFNNWIWQELYENGLPDHGFDTLVQAEEYRQWLARQDSLPLPDVEYYNRQGTRDNVAEWMNWRGLPHPVYDEQSEGTFYAQQAVEFMKNQGEKPFFVWLAFKEPHHPYYFPIEYAGKYRPERMFMPIGSPEDDRWVPEKFRDLSEAERRGIIASYYNSTEYMDKNVGLVLKGLEELQLDTNTVVLYISDNGYLLNDHKRFEKHTMWEEAVHQPMILRLGKNFRAGEREDALVEYIDVVPTLLELIAQDPIAEVQGKSLIPVIDQERDRHRPYTFSEYLEDNMAMICTDQWKYMFTTGRRDLGIGYQTGYGPSGIDQRLYHLSDDPRETKNLAKDPDYAELLEKMQQWMLDTFMRTHPDADHCPEGLSLLGKLVWFCEPRDIGADQSLRDFPYRVFRE